MRFGAILLAMMLALGADAFAQAPRRVALIIANAHYAAAGTLTNPANDAQTIASAAQRAGFQTVVVRDANLTAFQQALRDFGARANGAEAALVYYAGHGIEGKGQNWLIPTDATLSNENTLGLEAISLDQVIAAISGAQWRIVILDACRNNPFGNSWRSGTRAVTRGLAAVDDAEDTLVIYAAAPGQTASDGAGSNSPFASALAMRLTEQGLPVQLLGNNVRDDVLAATGGTQRPFVSGSMTGRLFYLVPGGAGALPPPPTPPPSYSAYDLNALNPQVRDAVIQARSKEALADVAASPARDAAQQAQAVAEHARNGEAGARAETLTWGSPSNTARYETEFSNGAPNGYGVVTYTAGPRTGDVYAGQWNGGRPNGVGVYAFAQNANNTGNLLRYEGEFAAGSPNGIGLYYWRDGTRYAGGLPGNVSGPGVLYYDGGGRGREGEWANGVLSGYGVQWNTGGHVDEQGIWTNGALTTPLSR